MALADRLKRYLSFSGKSLRDFEKQTGIPYRSLQSYTSGKSKPGTDQLVLMSEAGIDMNWLLTGSLRRPVHMISAIDENDDDINLIAADKIFVLAITARANQLTNEFIKYFFEKNKSLPTFEKILSIHEKHVEVVVRTAASILSTIGDGRALGMGEQAIIAMMTENVPMDAIWAIHDASEFVAGITTHKKPEE